MVVCGKIIRLGDEICLAASQAEFDKQCYQAKHCAETQSCHVWVVDFRGCRGKPEEIREPLMLPNTGVLNIEGGKV